jgi:hypothetical protein
MTTSLRAGRWLRRKKLSHIVVHLVRQSRIHDLQISVSDGGSPLRAQISCRLSGDSRCQFSVNLLGNIKLSDEALNPSKTRTIQTELVT